ncbi:hypothetical protein [Nocardioides sp.]|uniref:hypothetical protein n=1 Tax=Nocardioides sp. TaxID=35761 RepID=UPI002B2654D5|nr:hypothetical protein [Nocardioides sp.]
MVLLWLLPPVLVTLVAMAWVAWLGRSERAEVDRDEAVRRLGAALEGRNDHPRPWSRSRPSPGYAVAPRPQQRSSGVAVRRSSTSPTAGSTPNAGREQG